MKQQVRRLHLQQFRAAQPLFPLSEVTQVERDLVCVAQGSLDELAKALGQRLRPSVIVSTSLIDTPSSKTTLKLSIAAVGCADQTTEIL